MRRKKIMISIFYYLIFFGPGCLLPLLSVYLREEVHLTATQIGLIMSLGPIISMFTQPVWGLISDYSQKPVHVLIITMILSAAASIVFSFMESYLWVIVMTVFLYIPLSALTPVSDSITVNFANRKGLNYGSFRLWGAVGYAFGAFIIGRIAQGTSFSFIFYGFAISLLAGLWFAGKMPNEGRVERVRIGSGLLQLVRLPKFTLFLLAVFFTFGPMDANNTYFGLYLQDAGGTIAGIGLAWFLIAASEVPVIQYAAVFIRKYGTASVAILAGIISALRYLTYFFHPPIELIYLTTILQGISFGLFISASLQLVQEIAPQAMRTTAVAIYSAVGYGLGNWFFTMIGGIVTDMFDIYTMYLGFALISFVGVGLFWIVARMAHIVEKETGLPISPF